MQNLVITSAGQELMTSLIAEDATASFTKIATSEHEYLQSELETLTSLEDIKQEVAISKLERKDESSIEILAGATNEELTEGYYVKALGLYIKDGEGNEILYAVAIDDTPDYLPAFNNTAISNIIYRLNVKVSNSAQVTLEIAQDAYATAIQAKELQEQIDAITEKEEKYAQKDGSNATGTWDINITGNANTSTTAEKLSGFSAASATIDWGTLISSNGYTSITQMETENGGSVAFADKDQNAYMQLDGVIYQNEGKYKVLDSSDVELFGGIFPPDQIKDTFIDCDKKASVTFNIADIKCNSQNFTVLIKVTANKACTFSEKSFWYNSNIYGCGKSIYRCKYTSTDTNNTSGTYEVSDKVNHGKMLDYNFNVSYDAETGDFTVTNNGHWANKVEVLAIPTAFEELSPIFGKTLYEVSTGLDKKANADGTNAEGSWDIDITGNSETATKATSADSATKATQDGDGKNIASTYLKAGMWKTHHSTGLNGGKLLILLEDITEWYNGTNQKYIDLVTIISIERAHWYGIPNTRMAICQAGIGYYGNKSSPHLRTTDSNIRPVIVSKTENDTTTYYLALLSSYGYSAGQFINMLYSYYVNGVIKTPLLTKITFDESLVVPDGYSIVLDNKSLFIEAAKATSADSATKDASGNVITETYSKTNHTHNYAGSSSAGGAATSAEKLSASAGSALAPVYFSNGVPVETKLKSTYIDVGSATSKTFTLNKNTSYLVTIALGTHYCYYAGLLLCNSSSQNTWATITLHDNTADRNVPVSLSVTWESSSLTGKLTINFTDTGSSYGKYVRIISF